MDPVEMTALEKFVRPILGKLRPLLEQSYGYWYGDDCGDKCLRIAYIPRGIESGDRKAIIWFFRNNVDGYYVWPTSLRLLVTCGTNDPNQFVLDSVYYEGISHRTAEEVLDIYITTRQQEIRKYPFPPGGATHGSPEARDKKEPQGSPKRPPMQVEPDGRRFQVDGQHVKYMDWEFNFRLRTVNGLQLMDVRFRGERIAYEVSMSDVAVLYSGDAPEGILIQYVDAGFSLGALHFPVVKGYDCPDNAVYFNNTFFDSVSGDAKTHEDALCLFEHNTALPVRRHHSMNFFPLQPDLEDPYYYRFSMAGTVLVLRGIATVWNYDYVFDYVFHPNGVIETKVSSTGYIQAFTTRDDSKYGFYIDRDFGITGNLHHHLFNFKIDFDIGGQRNLFETWDLKLDETQRNELIRGRNVAMKQRYMERNLRRTEREALIDYNFNEPKYYVMYNERTNNSNGYPRGYRIYSPNFSKKLFPDGWYFENGVSWARHQLVVTRYKDDEDTSATLWTQGDPYRPVRKFSNFYEDNQAIVNEDLVVWACIGLHHIPVAEDVPVTTTPGKQLSVILAPLNFFDEDPSMTSRDAVVHRYRDEN
ncbi:amiloride-sensitive amine oxidase [copper-containing]-like [Lingula anatina]|uniref:Amine oxidase n=1 Tax=Lingula anatina TaxID=7574 RepID=A0A1S3KEU5_LINAN|nr:amiloride-sensitive amine oxidase [copper-containing]-like [Lingula anatina]|eukprot:XP_013421022.1 amiloride-sensitive amine oxidase [copper-containing]-like [Lingula anatina]